MPRVLLPRRPYIQTTCVGLFPTREIRNIVNNGIARITGMPRLVLILRILSRLDHAPRAADASRSTLVSRSGGVVVYTRQVRIRAI